MEDGSVTEAAKGKASSSSSLVVEIEIDKMLRGNEKLVGLGSVPTRAVQDKDSTSVEVEEKEMRGHSGGAKQHSSWVVEMGKMLEHAKPSVEMARWKQQSIYRVPEFIKKMTNGDAYRPHFVSLGPLHHGETHLQAMEEHKRRAVLHMVNRARKPMHEFVAAIDQVADELQAAYSDLDDKWLGENKGCFVEMMVTDGCFLLELISTAPGILTQEGINDYAANDPVYSKKSFQSLCPIIWSDMIAMENQLPLVVLERLLAVQYGTIPSSREINYMVGAFRHCEESNKHEPSIQCAFELSEAGVQFKKSNADIIHDIEFENGVLSMPLFHFHDNTETIFLNLMAFEWLHSNAKREVTPYISFMDQIIQSERDVALLKSQGLIKSLTGGNNKVVEIFNTLTRIAQSPDEGNKLVHVQWKLSAHCRKRRNRWRASFVNTYLSNPWAFISLLAAVILLVATLLQTIYTVVPFYTKGLTTTSVGCDL